MSAEHAFNEAIRELIDHTSVSWAELAKRGEISVSHLDDIYTGKALPSPRRLTRLFSACGLVSEGERARIRTLYGQAGSARDSFAPSWPGDAESVDGRALRPGGPPPLVPDAAGADCQPDPATANTKQEFAAVMREFRAWAGGHSLRDLAKWSNGAFSHTTIAAVLSGKVRATLGYVQGFVRACGADAAEVQRWSTAYRRVYEGLTPVAAVSGARPFEETVAQARRIRTYQMQFVPALLQTEDYARAVTLLSHPDAPGYEVEWRIGQQMRRQSLLNAEDPPHLWAVVDETVLRRPPGSIQMMRRQIMHLLERTESLNITLQVLPFKRGVRAAAGGPFSILRFAADHLPDVVSIEHLTSTLYLGKREDLDHYLTVMDRLCIDAEPATAIQDILYRILKETRA